MSEATVAACRECGSARINGNAYGGMRSRGDARGRYRCSDCGATFDEPVTRQRKGHADTQSGSARLLADADPEEVPR